MRDSRPQLFDDFFEDTSMLRNVQQHAVALLKLNQAVTALLPRQLQSQCRVGNYRKGVLVIETTNANWLMALRYEKEKLLSTLRQDILPSLITINFKINPALSCKIEQEKMNTAVKQEPNPRKISEATAEHLSTLADKYAEGSSLGEKLKRLASLAGESANKTSRK